MPLVGPDYPGVEILELPPPLVSDHAERLRAWLTDSYTRELHVHCYRMLGAFHDAEDAVHKSLLPAWRHPGSFANRSTFRVAAPHRH